MLVEKLRCSHSYQPSLDEPLKNNKNKIESGVTFQQLQKHLAKRGLSHGTATPGYGGISLGGAIATGAHGSSLKSSATISSYVLALDVAGPDGKLTTYSEGTTGKNDPVLWQALKTNLGLLGFVARIRLKKHCNDLRI